VLAYQVQQPRQPKKKKINEFHRISRTKGKHHTDIS
jgi:hypothetical protein